MTAADAAWLEQFRDAVLAKGQARTYRANTIIAQAGEPAESMYWILAGELAAFVEDEQGRVLELNRMRAGECFGELLLASTVRTASVRTVTECRLCRLGRRDVEALVLADPAFALEIIRVLARRLAALTQTVQEIALAGVYSRLHRFLAENAAPGPDGSRVAGVSQQDIADRLGASKSMVNRLLKDLQEGGYVDIGRRAVIVRKPLPPRW
ncbi:MAG: Crp/Fnr family transcriptional regulator [Burkholderiales bacterium]|nr:Crp/Fnr family transcriptional regulator [Burkholderiales bacterium]